MTRPSFIEGVLVALAASLAAGALFSTLTLALRSASALRWVIALVGLGYVLYLLGRSGARVGRVSTVLVWTLVSGAALALPLPLAPFVLLQGGMVWLIRSLYFHAGLAAALADLGLALLGLSAAVWAATQTGSLALAAWSLFLVQALFGLIPSGLARTAPGPLAGAQSDDAFERAHRGAEAALRRIHSL
jgi:hypothetical protein